MGDFGRMRMNHSNFNCDFDGDGDGSNRDGFEESINRDDSDGDGSCATYPISLVILTKLG